APTLHSLSDKNSLQDVGLFQFDRFQSNSNAHSLSPRCVDLDARRARTRRTPRDRWPPILGQQRQLPPSRLCSAREASFALAFPPFHFGNRLVQADSALRKSAFFAAQRPIWLERRSCESTRALGAALVQFLRQPS